ncbi:hypothetical protein AAF712_010368 [Marasmius tenuissimus]|uniref:Uncharacterized protein n=1 Tax=Marasmius tenuissimus TaxID=585030 RepID=A0ABR2ZNW0_9AGAR
MDSALGKLGPVFIGNIFETCLVGMVTIQAVVFLMRPVSRWDKVICISLWLLMFLHLMSIVRFSYQAIFVWNGDARKKPIGWDYSIAAVLDILCGPPLEK